MVPRCTAECGRSGTSNRLGNYFRMMYYMCTYIFLSFLTYAIFRGWHGKSDVPLYNMWDYMNKPPKGRPFGIRTHKISASHSTKKANKLLKTDTNAWVGFQTSLMSPAELRPKLSKLEVELLHSPLARRSRLTAVKIVPEKADIFEEEKKRRKKEKLEKYRNKQTTSPFNMLEDDNTDMTGPSEMISTQLALAMSSENSSDDNCKYDFHCHNENHKKTGYWEKKFKRLFVTPMRGIPNFNPKLYNLTQNCHPLKNQPKTVTI